MKTCFVVCVISDPDSEQRKNSDKLFKNIIEPVCAENEYEVVRADKINDIDKIDNTILEHLQKSDLVIADLTYHNPNVFYEIGYRTALGKPTIQLIKENERIPFDVSMMRTITYDFDIEKVKEATNRISETIKNITPMPENEKNVNIPDINFQIMSYLLDIKDTIYSIKNDIVNISENNTKSLISAFADQFQRNSKTTENNMMELLFKQAIDNPTKLDNLINMAEKYKNFQK